LKAAFPNNKRNQSKRLWSIQIVLGVFACTIGAAVYLKLSKMKMTEKSTSADNQTTREEQIEAEKEAGKKPKAESSKGLEATIPWSATMSRPEVTEIKKEDKAVQTKQLRALVGVGTQVEWESDQLKMEEREKLRRRLQEATQNMRKQT
jgi:uncharacterized membrane protein